MLENYDWKRLQGLGFNMDFVEKATGELKDTCWKGYTAVGTKKKRGREVPNCVPIEKKHSENPLDEMSPGELPEEPIPGGGDKKNPQMGEAKMRMPRSDVLKKASDTNGQLARMASNGSGDGGYSEHSEEFSSPFDSNEPNGAMAVNQLRVMKEKIDIMLGMISPEDHLPPWCATKLANSSQNLASVADYLRFGVET